MQYIKYRLLCYSKYLGTVGALTVWGVIIEGGGCWKIFLNLIDDFGVSDAVTEISVHECNLDFGPA